MSKMVSPTSFIHRDRRKGKRGFTLVEVLIAAGLSGLVLLGVLQTFIMMGRVSANIQNYTEIEAGARKALEMMSREVRLAFHVVSYNGSSVTLAIPDSTTTIPNLSSGTSPLYNQQAAQGAYTVTYAYNSSTKRISRTGPPIFDPTGTSTTSTLLSNVQPMTTGGDIFTYYRYVNTDYLNSYQNGYQNNTVAVGSPAAAIQQLEVKFLASRATRTVTTATNKVISARFILRNKR